MLNEETLEDITVPIEVEYQSRPPSCPSCKVFGHSPLKCPKSNFKWIPKAQFSSGTTTTVTNQTGPSGLATAPRDDIPKPSSNSSALGLATPASVPTDWVIVSRGAKAGKDPSSAAPSMSTSNSFSPIANPAPLLVSDNESPPADNPLVSKLKVVDEKEGKDLKHKLRKGSTQPQDAKRRNKGKGREGNGH